nr:polyphosphate polymerase domain-containing protein [bacterium]
MAATFKRYETKYILSADQCQALRQELAPYTVPDAYCRDGRAYSICNLYLDTPDNRVIRHSLQHPAYKEKMRLRSYGVPGGMDACVFLEMKKKMQGIVTKRRVEMALGQAYDFIRTGRAPPLQGYMANQVARELAVSMAQQPVAPAVYISYRRIALYGIQDKALRITFDDNILSRRENVRLEDGIYGKPILEPGKILMEIKMERSVPLWLAGMLSRHGIYRTGFSKYGKEYQRYITDLQADGLAMCV